MDKRILVVGNPVSGAGRGARLLEGVAQGGEAITRLAERCEAGDPASWPVVRTTADDAWRLEVEAFIQTRDIRTVLVIGGDGTLMEVAALLYKLRAQGELAVVPVPGGRGNDFARAIYGYTSDDGDFWAWADGRARKGARWNWRPLDLGSADGKLFLNMASIGFGGRVVEKAQGRKAFWSKTALVYQVEGLLAMTGPGDSSVDVKVDGASVYTGAFFGAFVGNGKCNGSGLYWTREASFDDGMLDGIVFPKPNLIEMTRAMSAIKSVANPAPPIPMRHKLFRGKELAFHFDRPTALELDGDYVRSAMSHGFICLPKALRAWLLG